MKHGQGRMLAVLVGVVLAWGVGAALGEELGFRGAMSKSPGRRWDQGFVSGNGRLGAVLFGDAGEETLVANHCRLFLPQGNREIVPDLVKYVPELREIIRTKNYGEAMRFFLGKAKEQGYPGIIFTDPYHPAMMINIRQKPEGAVQDYLRTENFQTGEVTVRWRDGRGEFVRRMFVSRVDNLIAMSIKGPVACELEFPAIGQALIDSQQQTGGEWVTYHNVYVKGKGGYDVAVRIVRKDDGRDVLVLARVAPFKTPVSKERSEAWAYSAENPDFKKPGVFNAAPALAESSVTAYLTAQDAAALLPQLKQSLEGVKAGYEELLLPHARAHGALFNRVALDLGGGADRALTSEELLDIAKNEKRLPAALMEKMYDAGRYMFICAAGEMLPNLQGIWTGSWRPAWSGDFTLDTNVQAAMASACSANLGDLMEGYFRTMESFYPEWRINAQRIYGCRGYFSNARASNTCLELHWGTWQGVFWTAGCGWLASFFSDYADYSADREFLQKRCVPLLKEIAAFYGDFLSQSDKDGRVVFIPSYNPETGCGINANMDVAVARETLMRLTAACRLLQIERENIPKWEALLGKLPAYAVNDHGELCEFPGSAVAVKHRHHSQLYPCYQSFDPLFETNGELRKAAQATVRAKIAGSDGGGEQSSFGRVQCGVSAAYLGMAEEAYGRVAVMAMKRSMTPSLITSHEPGAGIFNTDGNGGIPQIVNTMLVFSRAGRIDLLPALPKAWGNGSITGVRARGGVELDIAWKEGRLECVTLRPKVDGEWRVNYGSASAVIKMAAGQAIRLDGNLRQR